MPDREHALRPVAQSVSCSTCVVGIYVVLILKTFNIRHVLIPVFSRPSSSFSLEQLYQCDITLSLWKTKTFL